MISKEKVRNQVKSRFYYLFWGIATVSVVFGQLYVGSGYRMFARSLNRIFDTVEVEVGQDYRRDYYCSFYQKHQFTIYLAHGRNNLMLSYLT